MPLWGSVDNAANSVISATAQVNKSISTTERDLLFGNTAANAYIAGATIGQFGVDTTEVGATAGIPHSGWVLRTEGSGGRAGRVFHEVLVAGGSMSGDAEDIVMPDYTIVISTQPQDSSETSGDPASFSVVATTQPAGGSLSYQWQVDGGPSVESFANVANTGVYASENGNTSATLSISDNSTLDGNVFRVLVYVAGGNTVTSANATLTEV